MPSQAVLCFIKMHFMATILESIESTDAGNSATDNGNSLPLLLHALKDDNTK